MLHGVADRTSFPVSEDVKIVFPVEIEGGRGEDAAMFCREKMRVGSGREDALHDGIAVRVCVCVCQGEFSGGCGFFVGEAFAVAAPGLEIGGIGKVPSFRGREFFWRNLFTRRFPKFRDSRCIASGRADFGEEGESRTAVAFSGKMFLPVGGGFQQGCRPGGCELLTDRGLQGGEFVAVLFEDSGGIDRDRRGQGRGENSEERVIIRLADRVELVVVAARTRNGQSEEGLRHGVDLVVGEADAFIEGVGRGEAVEDHAEVAESESALVDLFCGIESGCPEEIAGEVLEEKLVVGHIGVERADEVVAIL